jgi:hypothetical protein
VKLVKLLDILKITCVLKYVKMVLGKMILANAVPTVTKLVLLVHLLEMPLVQHVIMDGTYKLIPPNV